MPSRLLQGMLNDMLQGMLQAMLNDMAFRAWQK
jgi:hypothetical protein